jgi:hypothetical protein
VDYWGTVVVARPRGLLADQDGIGGFGFRHSRLRELGGGWQALETRAHDDPPDLQAPAASLVAATGHPVLAAYVSDSDCAVICAAVPGRVGPLTHLWDVTGPCGVYRHQPRGMPEPVGRDLAGVVAELTSWSGAAGLCADTARVRAILGHDRRAAPRDAEDLLFELVAALGPAEIDRTVPATLPVESAPFSRITSRNGLASLARSEASYREAAERRGWVIEPVAFWEEAAITLEAELWASQYRAGVDVDGLARRAIEIQTAYDAAEKPQG